MRFCHNRLAELMRHQKYLALDPTKSLGSDKRIIHKLLSILARTYTYDVV